MSWYNKLLTKYPIATKSATAGIIAGTSDVISQKLQEKYLGNHEYSLGRTIQYASVGAFWVTPLIHMHYSYILPYLFPGTSMQVGIMKMVFD